MLRGLLVPPIIGGVLCGSLWIASNSAGAADSGAPASNSRHAPAIATLDDRKAELADAANGWTVDVGLTNLTGSALTVTARPVHAATGCSLKPEPASLPRYEHTTVTFAVPDACSVANGFSLIVTVKMQTPPIVAQSMTVRAAKATKSSVDWSTLNAFWISLIVFVLLALIIGLILSSRVAAQARKDEPPNTNGATSDEPEAGKGVLGKLPYLDTTWSFGDSWLNNVTVGAGLLTGIVGSSDVAKALLGSDADTKLRLATVGAAIGVAIIAAAPLVLAIFKTRDGAITIVGLFLAAGLSMAAAVGLLVVMGKTADELDVPGLSWWVAIPPIALVLVYGVVSLAAVVETGITKPDDPPESDALKAAALVAAAIISVQSRMVVQGLQISDDHPLAVEAEAHRADLQARQREVDIALSTDKTRPRRRRAALL